MIGKAHARQEIERLNKTLEKRVRQLTESNQDLEAFSYSVAHDLQTPLAAIDGFLNLLDHAVAENDLALVKHCARQIHAGVQEMGQLTAGLLAVARVSTTELRCENVNLSAQAEAILKAHQEQEPERHVEVHVEPELWVRGDPLLIRQVLVNLLGNAWKFTSHRPHAIISFAKQSVAATCPADAKADEYPKESCESSKPKCQTTFVVTDNGAGFDMAYADRLFGTFERLHTQEEFAGTGIGLATVKRIINRHGGCVSAESTPDQGAVFRFTLPPALPD
jgi:signal transduction histidine kinase